MTIPRDSILAYNDSIRLAILQAVEFSRRRYAEDLSCGFADFDENFELHSGSVECSACAGTAFGSRSARMFSIRFRLLDHDSGVVEFWRVAVEGNDTPRFIPVVP